MKEIIQKFLERKSSTVSKVGRLRQKCRQYTRQNRIKISAISLSVLLSSLTLYLLLSPLPDLPAPQFSEQRPATAGTGPARALAALDMYLQPLKSRDLFKPSVPIPTKSKIGKTTAQQLAERLRFLGTTRVENALCAVVFIPERGPGSFRKGDRVAEFVLKDIKKDSLVLELEDEQITLKR